MINELVAMDVAISASIAKLNLSARRTKEVFWFKCFAHGTLMVIEAPVV